MRRALVVCMVLIFLIGPGALAGDRSLGLEGPVLITSAGQNLDALIIKTVVDELGISADYLALAEPESLGNYRHVIITPGMSYKGLAVAQTTAEAEIQRTKNLVRAADELSCHVILLYLGGFVQGDVRSQELVELLTPIADVIIMYEDGGGPSDYFSRAAEEKGVPLFFIEDLGNLRGELKSIFGL